MVARPDITKEKNHGPTHAYFVGKKTQLQRKRRNGSREKKREGKGTEMEARERSFMF